MPNGAIMNNHMINFTTEGKIRVDLKIGVSYKADIAQARKAILAVMEADSRVLTSPAPLVAVAALGDSSIVLAVRPWCDPTVYWDVYFETLEK